jgi:hypothetical protein
MRSYTASIVAVFLISIFLAVPAFAQAPAPVALDPSNMNASSFQANWDTTGYHGRYQINHYLLDVATDNGFTLFVSGYHDASIGTGPEVVGGLTTGVTYFYRVRSVNAGGTSPYSNTIRVPLLVPPVASGATNITSTGFTAHWGAVPGATDYLLEVAKLGSFGPVVHTSVWDTHTGNVVSYNVTGLLPDTTYYYRLRTVSANGQDSSTVSNFIAVSRIMSAGPLASGTIGVPYSVTVQYDGTAGPASWAVLSGSLPTGLSISTDGTTGLGVISGTPTAIGKFNFVAQVTDNTPAPATKAMSIEIVSVPTIAFDAVVGNKYAYTTGAEDVPATFTWDHTVGLGSNRMLIVQAGATAKTYSHAIVTGVTYNGKALTLAKQQSESNSITTADYINIGQWYMMDKDLPNDSAAHPVVVTYGGLTTGETGGSISLKYVKQVAPEAVVSDSGIVTSLNARITTLSNHAWLVNAAVNGYSGSFFDGHNQEVRYQIDNGNFDLIGDTKEVSIAGPDSMNANHHIEFRMAQVVIAVAPVASVTANAGLKFFLQGPYVTAGDTMSNGLKTGTDHLLAGHFGAGNIPAWAVDSVNIEIRDSLSASKSLIRAFTPAWLLTDGSVRDFVDTTKHYVGFGGVPAGNYYIVVRHRNHLAIMSSVRYSVDGSLTPVVYDFSTGQGQAFGTNAMAATGTRFSLISGNATSVDQLINSSDRVATRNNLGANTYIPADVNMDGLVNSSDRVITRNNLGLQSQVP